MRKLREEEEARSHGFLTPQANTAANANRRVVVTRSDRQRQKCRNDPAEATQEEIAAKARQLWAADRVAARLARAVNLVRDGKVVSDPELLLAAVEKFQGVVYDADEKMAERCSRLAAQESGRRQATEAQRKAQQDKEANRRLLKQAAEAARQALRSEREMQRSEKATEMIETKRTRELARRNRDEQELVEKEWTKEQEHVHASSSRELQRREGARALQEREHKELVRRDDARRRKRVEMLETEQMLKEAADPQVLKALPGSAALLGGHRKNIAPYAQQQRQHIYQLSRWQYPV